MNNICRVCGSEKKYDNIHNIYKRCAPCNSRKVLRYYYNNRDVLLEKNKNYYQNNKEYFREYYRKRVNKISDLQNQIKQLTEITNTNSHTCNYI